MTLGYPKPIILLAFDHHGSFQHKLLGIVGTPTAASELGAVLARPVDDLTYAEAVEGAASQIIARSG